MEALVSPVTLIVKSCNQQFEDQEVRCELNWTIGKVKQTLTEVYPSKPRTDEQKLIYSGQLLQDGVVLKDVLRQYEGQDTHTVHLVYVPKNQKLGLMKKETSNKKESPAANLPANSGAATVASGADVTDSTGLRHRSAAGASTVPASSLTTPVIPVQQQQFQATHQPIPNPFLNPNYFYNTFQAAAMVPPAMASVPSSTQHPNPADYPGSQQVVMQAWMQQAYVQYINQYMNMLQVGAQSTPLYASAAPGGAPGFPNYAYLTPPTAATTAPGPSAVPQGAQAAANQAVVAGAPDAAVGDQPAQPQRRFPNIVVEEAQDNRDWLDISFTTLRVAVLLSLIYFYSTPLRVLAVVTIGIALFLYRRGLFRNLNEFRQNNQRPQQQAAAAQNNNNNADPAAGDPQVDPTTDAVVDPNRPSMLATLRTFIFSFIFSLIPDTPAL